MVFFRTKRHDIDKGSFTLREVVKKSKVKGKYLGTAGIRIHKNIHTILLFKSLRNS